MRKPKEPMLKGSSGGTALLPKMWHVHSSVPSPAWVHGTHGVHEGHGVHGANGEHKAQNTGMSQSAVTR